MKNTSGFTIIELLAVIFIIALIPLLFMNSFGKTSSTLQEENKASGNSMLYDAIEIYYYLSMKEGTLSYYPSGGKNVSCISLQTLISNGYLIEEQYDSNKYAYLEVEKGVLNYRIIDRDAVKDDGTPMCEYEDVSIAGIPKTDENSVTQGGTDEESGVGQYKFLPEVTTIDVNQFKVNILFDFQSSLLIEMPKKETYVMMILDNSGSMGSEKDPTSKMYLANSAVTNLSKILSEANDGTFTFCTGLIYFNTSAGLKHGFTTASFESDIAPAGLTNYATGLNLAYTKIYTPINSENTLACQNSDKESSNIVVIFLSDGAPSDAQATYKAAAESLKNKGAKVISIGFDISATALQIVASGYNPSEIAAEKGCDDRPNSICYYPNTTDISKLLGEIAKTTVREAKSKSKKAVFKIKLSKYFSFNGSKYAEEESGFIKIPVDLTNIDSGGKVVIENLDFDIKYNEGSAEFNSSDTAKIPLFDSVFVTFLDENGEPVLNASGESEIEIPNIPQITLTKYKTSAIN